MFIIALSWYNNDKLFITDMNHLSSAIVKVENFRLLVEAPTFIRWVYIDPCIPVIFTKPLTVKSDNLILNAYADMNIQFWTSAASLNVIVICWYCISKVGTNWPQVESRWALETWADVQASGAAVSTLVIMHSCIASNQSNYCWSCTGLPAWVQLHYYKISLLS